MLTGIFFINYGSEDMVVDLHCAAQALDDVGERCGFDGKGVSGMYTLFSERIYS